MHDAVLEDRREVINLLIKRGANINAMSTSGYTPLDEALLRHNDSLAKELRARHAKTSKEISAGKRKE